MKLENIMPDHLFHWEFWAFFALVLIVRLTFLFLPTKNPK